MDMNIDKHINLDLDCKTRLWINVDSVCYEIEDVYHRHGRIR